RRAEYLGRGEILLRRQRLVVKHKGEMLGERLRQAFAGRGVDRFGQIDAGNLGADRGRQRREGEIGHGILAMQRLAGWIIATPSAAADRGRIKRAWDSGSQRWNREGNLPWRRSTAR